MTYHFIVTGYQCIDYVERCYESFLKLNNLFNWRAVFISDGCSETSFWLRKNINHDRITFITHLSNRGAAYCRYQAINQIKPDDEDVIILVGMDDEIMPFILDIVNKQYDAGKWMTYGNWIDQTGRGLPKDFKLDFDEITHVNRDYRKVLYRSTAPNTFKYFLFKEIPEEDFKINGEWITTTTESEVMFSCLEMCGKERIGVINKPIYLYNKNLPGGTLKRLGRSYKYQILDIIKSRPKRKQLFR